MAGYDGWDRSRPDERDKPPPRPVSRRRYVVAVVLGAVVVFASSRALFAILGDDSVVVVAYGLGIFAAGWNTRARSVIAWLVVAVLTFAATLVLGLASFLLASAAG
jgi:hypothetical protein